MADNELQMQLEQQQLMIEQFKELIRKQEVELDRKDKELQDTNSKLSKIKLQNKAKQAKMTRMEEAKKPSADEKDKGAEMTHLEDSPASHAGRAKLTLMKRQLEEKDRIIKEKDEVIFIRQQQIEAKERVLAERETFVSSLREQLEEKTKTIETLQSGQSLAAGDGDTEQSQIQAMYAQMVYKDRKLLEMNNKVLEQDRKVMDLQELVGETQEVIRGRDKVIEILQASLNEHKQNVLDQTKLIAKLTAKIEANEEAMEISKETLRKTESQLKTETDRFHMKLTETQKYFEETLAEKDSEVQRFQLLLQEKDKELAVHENDLREVIQRHEQDIQRIMMKEEVNIQDEIIRMFEQKLKDTNEVLVGKVRVIEVLQKEAVEKEREIVENKEALKLLREKLQVTSEQLMLLQANFVDAEKEWKEEKHRLEVRHHDMVEKHEHESSEKELLVENLRYSLVKYETAYAEATSQYSALQERYQYLQSHGLKVVSEGEFTGTVESVDQQALIAELKKELQEKHAQLEEAKRATEDGGGKTETKMLKLKAQMTSKIKSLEKELDDLRRGSELADKVMQLNNKVTELEDEKGNLQLKLMDLEEARVTISHQENQIKDLEAVCAQTEIHQQQTAAQLEVVIDERNKYSQIVADLQTQVESLSEQVKNLKETMDTLDRSYLELNSEKVSLELKMVEMEEQREGIEAEKNELLLEVERWKEKVEYEMQPNIAFEKENEDIRQQLDKVEVKLTEQQELNKQQKETVNRLTTELSTLHDQNSALNLEIDELKSQLNIAMLDRQNALSEVQQLKEELKMVEEKLAVTEAQLHRAYRDHKEQMHLLEMEKDSLAELIKQQELVLQESQHQQSAAAKEHSVLESELRLQLADKSDQEKKLFQQLDAANAQNSKHETVVAVLKVDQERLEEEIKSKASLVTSLELQVKQMAREAEVLREGQSEKGKEFESKTQTLLDQLSELETELTRQQTLSGKFEEEVARLNYELQCIQQEKKSIEVKLKENVTASEKQEWILEQQKSEINSLAESLKSECEKNAKIQEDLTSLQLQREREISDKDFNISSLTEKLNSVVLDLNEKTEHLRQSEKNMLDLKSCLQQRDESLQDLQTKTEELNITLTHISDSLNTDLIQARQEIEALKDKLEKSERYVSDLLNSQTDLEDHLKCRQQEVIEKTFKLNELMQLQEENQQLISRKDLDHKSLSAEIIQLKASLEDRDQLLLGKNDQMETLAAELESREEMCSHLESSLKRAEEEKERMSEKGMIPDDHQQENDFHAELGLEKSDKVAEHLKASHLHQDSTASLLSTLQDQLLSAQTATATLQATLEKKEKIIQGLQLKTRKLATKSKAKIKEPAAVDANLTNKVIKNVDQPAPRSVTEVKSAASVSLLGSSSPSLLGPEGGTWDSTDKRLQQLAQEKQYLIIERDTLKEICEEKDAEIVHLQTQFYEAEYKWKEMVEARDADISRLLQRYHGSEDVSQDLLLEKEELEQLLELKKSELLYISQQFDHLKKKSKEDVEKFTEISKKFDRLQDENTILTQQQDTHVEDIKQLQDTITSLQNQMQIHTQNAQVILSASSQKEATTSEETQKLVQQLMNLEAQVSIFKQNVDILEKEKMNANECLKEYMTRTRELEHSLQEHEAETEELKKAISEKENQVLVMESVMKSMLDEQSTDEPTMLSLSSELESAKKLIVSLQTELSESKKILMKKEAKIASISKKLREDSTLDEPRERRLSVFGDNSSCTGSSILGSQYLAGSTDTVSSGMHEDGYLQPKCDIDGALDETCIQLNNSSFRDKISTLEIEELKQEVLLKDKQLSEALAEVHSIKKQMKRKEAKVYSLSKQLSKLRQETPSALISSVTEIEPETSLMSKMESSLSSVPEDIQELLRERDRFEMCLRNAEDSLHRAEERNDILEQDLEETDSKLQLAEQERNSFEADLLDIQAMVYQRPREDFTYVTDMRDIKSRLHHLLGDRLSVSAHIALKQDLQALEWEKNDIQEHLMKAEDFITKLEDEKENLEQKLQEVNDALQHTTEKVVILRQEITELQNLSSLNKEEVKTENTCLNVMPDRLLEFEKEKEEMVSNLKAMVSKLEQAEREKQILEERLNEVRGDLADADNYYRHLHEDLTNQVQQLEKQVKEIRHENSLLHSKNSEEDKQIKELLVKVESLEISLKSAQHDKEMAERQIVAVEKDVDYQRTRAEKLLKLLREKDSSEASVSNIVAQLEAKEESLKNENHALHHAFSQMQQQHAQDSQDIKVYGAQMTFLTQDNAQKAERISLLMEQISVMEESIVSRNDDQLELERMLSNIKIELKNKSDLAEQAIRELSILENECSQLKQQREVLKDLQHETELKRNNEISSLLDVKQELQNKLIEFHRRFEEDGNKMSLLEQQLTTTLEQLQKETELRKTIELQMTGVQEQLFSSSAYIKQQQELKQQMEETINSLQQQLLNISEQIKIEQEIKRQQQQKLTDAEKCAHHEQEQRRVLENKIEQMQLELDRMKASVDTVELYRQQLEKEQYRCSELAAQVDELHQKCFSRECEISQLSQMFADLDQQLKERTNMTELLTQDITVSQSELDKNVKINDLKAFLANAQSENTVLKEELNNAGKYQIQNTGLQQELLTIKQDLEVEEKRLQEGCAPHDTNAFAAPQQHDPSTSLASVSDKSEVDILKAKIADMQKTLIKKESRITSLLKQIDKIQKEASFMTRQYEEVKEEMIRLQSYKTGFLTSSPNISQNITEYFTPPHNTGNEHASRFAHDLDFFVDADHKICELEKEIAVSGGSFPYNSVDEVLLPSKIDASTKDGKDDDWEKMKKQLEDKDLHVAEMRQTIETFTQQLHIYGQRGEELENQLDALQEQKEYVEQLASEKASQIADLQDKLSQALSEKVSSESALLSIQTDLNSKLAEALKITAIRENSLETQNQEFANISCKLSQILLEKSEMEKEMSNLNQQLEEMELKLFNMLRVKDEAENKIERLEQELKSASEMIAQQRAMTEQSADHLSNRLQSQMEENFALQGQLLTCQQELRAAHDCIDMAQKEKDVIQSKCSSLMDIQANFENQLALFKNDMESLKDQLLTSEEARETLQKQVEDLVEENSFIKKRLQETESETENKSKQIFELETNFSKLTISLCKLEEDNLSVKQEFETLKESANSTSEQFVELQQKKSNQDEHMIKLEATLRDLSDKCMNTQAELLSKQTEVEVLHSQLEAAQSLQSATESEGIIEMTVVVQQLTEHLKESQSLHLAVEKELEHVKSKLEATQAALATKETQLQESEASFGLELASILAVKNVMETRITELDSQVKELMEQLSLEHSKKSDRENMEQVLEAMNEQLLQKADQMVDLQALLMSANAKIADQEQKLKIKEEKMKSLVDSMQEMEERIEQLTAETETAQVEVQTRSEEIAALKAEFAVKEQNLVGREKHVSDKELILKKALATVKKLKFQLQQATAQIEKLQQEKEGLLHQQVQSVASRPGIEELTLSSKTEESLQGADNVEVVVDTVDSSLESAHMQELQLQLQAYADYCQRLQEQVQELTEDKQTVAVGKLQAMQQQVEQMQQDRDRLQQNLLVLQEQLTHAEQNFELAKSDYVTLQNELKHAQDNAEHIQQEKVLLEQNLIQVKQDFEHSARDFASLQHKFEQADQKSSEAFEECSLLRLKIQDLEDQVQTLQRSKDSSTSEQLSEIESLKQLLMEKEKKVEELTVLVENLRSFHLEQIELKDTFDSQMTSLLSTVETMQGTLHSREMELAEMLNHMSDLKQKLALRDEEVKELQSSLAALQEMTAMTKSNLEAVTEDYNERCSYLESEKADLEKQRDYYITELEAEKESKQELNTKLENVQILKDQVSTDLEAMKEKFQEQLVSLSSELSDSKQQLIELSEANASLTTEFESKSASQSDVVMQLESQVHALNKEISDYQHQIETLNSNRLLQEENLHVHMANYEQEIQLLKDQLVEFQSNTLINEESSEELKLRLETVLNEKKNLEISVYDMQQVLHKEKVSANMYMEETSQELDHLKSELQKQTLLVCQKDEELSNSHAVQQTLDARVRQLLHEMENISQQKEQLEFQCDTLRGEIEGMEKVIAEVQFAERDSSSERNRLQQDLNKVLQDNAVLKNQLEQVQMTSGRPGHEVVKIPEKRRSDSWDWESQVEVEKPIVEHQSLQQSAAIVPQTESMKHQQELQALMQEYQQLQQEHDKLRSKLQVSEVKCEKMLEKLKVFKVKNERQRVTLEEVEQNAEQQLRDVRRTLEEQIQLLRARLRDIETHNGQLIHENNTLRATAIEATAFAKTTEEMERLKALANSFQQKIHQLENEKVELEDNHRHQLSEAFAQAQNQFEEILQNAKKEAELYKGKFVELQEANRLQQESMDQERKTLMKEKEAYQVIDVENGSLRSQLADLQSHHAMLQQDNNQYQEVLASLSSANKELKRQVEQLRFDLNRVTSSSSPLVSSPAINHPPPEAVEPNVSLLKDVEDLHSQLSHLQVERDEIAEDLDRVTQEVIALRHEKQALINKTEEVNQEISHLQDSHKTEVASLQEQIDGLNWKLEEASGLEEELEEVRKQLFGFTEEDRNKLLSEISHLSGKVQYVEALESQTIDLQQQINEKHKELEETKLILSVKEEEIEKLQNIVSSSKTQNMWLKEEINDLNQKLKEASQLEEKILLLTQQLEVAQNEAKQYKRQADAFNSKLDTVRLLETDFESLSEEYNSVLRDNSNLAQQLEELHIRIGELTRKDHKSMLDGEELQHLNREKEQLINRVLDLEQQADSLLSDNARLMQELSAASVASQQLSFQNEALRAQSQVTVTSEDQVTHDTDHGHLQEQFHAMLEQKNELHEELNQAHHSLKQREARCQQLAMQVSQLVEDRTYLNVQLGTLSRSLREKEAEWLAMRQQYASLYQAHIGTQSKVGELERRIALDSLQKDVEVATSAESDFTKQKFEEERFESLAAEHKKVVETLLAVEGKLAKEVEARVKAEHALGEAQEHIRLQALGSLTEFQLQVEDDADSRIRETSALLTRDEMGFIQRIRSLLRVRSRQLSRLMRMRPGIRTVIWVYFICLHLLILACFTGIL